jgi:hypothetical protein
MDATAARLLVPLFGWLLAGGLDATAGLRLFPISSRHDLLLPRTPPGTLFLGFVHEITI